MPFKDRATKNANRRRVRSLQHRLLDKLKDKPCSRCHKRFPPIVMDWHHRDPRNKKFTIGTRLGDRSWKAMLLEIRKCQLICSNCHRIKTYKNK